MDASDLNRDPVEELAEEFLQRRRAGEEPSVEEYAQKHPQWAQRIRALFPTLLLVEDCRPDTATETEAAVPEEPAIRRLGDYRIIREIGRGGMGVVYEAEQQSLSRRVAVKVLPGVYLSSPKSLKRFHREARAAARLHHTNIVPVFGVGQQDGIHYYVMQYIRGQGLDQVLTELSLRQTTPTGGRSRDATEPDAEQPGTGEHSAAQVARTVLFGRFAPTATEAEEAGKAPAVHDEVETPLPGMALSSSPLPTDSTPPPMSSEPGVPRSADGAATADFPAVLASRAGNSQYWQSVAGIGVQVAGALDYAHHQGTLHRDIKPGNLLLDTRGTVWIADFGLAKLIEQDDVTRSGDVVGTLRYMAPEQFDGRCDPRSDVYSLGLTLYELSTLRPAFDGKDRGKLILQVTCEEPPPPRSVNRDIPRDLETIVTKAIARDPVLRYQSAGELAEDLQRFLEDRPIHARRISPIERLWRWCRRNRAVAALSGVALALLVAIAVVGTAGYFHTSAALRRESIEREKAETARKQADEQRRQTLLEYERAEGNLQLAMQAFEEVFDKVAAVPVVQPLGRIDDATSEEDEDQEEGVWQELGAESVVTEKDAAVLQSMLKFYDRFAQQNRGKANLQEETARAYRRVGEIQQRLGNLDAAERAYKQALAAYRQLNGAANLPGHVVAAAAVGNKLGTIRGHGGRFLEARQAHADARDFLLGQPPDISRQPACRLELARTYNLLAAGTLRPDSRSRGPGGAMSKRGPFARMAANTAANHEKALEILRALVKKEPENPQYQLELARTYRSLSAAARDSHKEGADRARREAIRIFEKLAADAPANPDYRFELAETYALLSRRGRGKASTADAEQLDRAIRIETELVDRYPNVPQYQVALARRYIDQVRIQQSSGQLAEAEQSARRAIGLQQALVEKYPTAPHYRAELARNLFMLAHVYRRAGQMAEASIALRKAIHLIEAVSQEGPGGRFARMMLARAYKAHAELLKKLGRKEEAAEAVQKAKKLGANTGGPSRGPFRPDRGRPSHHRRPPDRDNGRKPKPPQGP